MEFSSRLAWIDTKAELAVAKAKASEDLALISHQKLRVAKLERRLYRPRSVSSTRLIDQMKLQFEEAEADATEDELAAERAVATTTNVAGFTRRRPVERITCPDHLPRERVVIEAPTTCTCCGGARSRKLGEDVTRTPRVGTIAALALSDQGVKAMVHVAKPTKSTKPVDGKRKPGRPATQTARPAPKATKPATAAAAPRRASAVAAPAPQLSVGELRLLVEKLERNEATLRVKNREAGRAAKTAAARIAELEQREAGLETEATKQTAIVKPGPKPASAPATRAKRRSQGDDPGDAVPPGVAVAEPASLDVEAEAAREKLEHLGGE